MATVQNTEFTGRMGPLIEHSRDADVLMYSYERPAWILWESLANALIARGWKQKEVADWLQSKEARWALDGELGDALTALANQFAQTAVKVK